MIIEHAPIGSALANSMYGEQGSWSVSDYLLATIGDILNGANWQRGGGKGPKPERIKRPGTKDKTQSFGADPIPISAFNDWWNAN